MHWKIKEYDDWISVGCQINSEITILNILFLDVQSIPPNIKNLVNLQEFYCSFNQITIIPPEIGQLVILHTFECSNNYMSVLPYEIGQLVNLHTFDCSNNNLTVLPAEIGHLVNLHTFNCRGNQLTVIPPEIGQLVNLHIFYCDYNNLTILPSEIGHLIELYIFDCSNNNLTVLPREIGRLVNLQYFVFSSNQLTVLPPEIGQLVNLQAFNYSNNPIEHIPPNVIRLINRIKHSQGIYNDRQSVHNSSIQESIKASIMKLLLIKPSLSTFEPITELILADQTLTDFTKESLLEYSKDDSVHSILNITFAELLIVVWNRIVSNPNSAEIKMVLNQEMKDASCMCFTGRISRLVNCLSGFDDLVSVKISDSEQIGNVIATIKDKLELAGNYSVEEHKRLATNQLTELGYSTATIQEWVDFIG